MRNRDGPAAVTERNSRRLLKAIAAATDFLVAERREGAATCGSEVRRPTNAFLAAHSPTVSVGAMRQRVLRGTAPADCVLFMHR